MSSIDHTPPDPRSEAAPVGPSNDTADTEPTPSSPGTTTGSGFVPQRSSAAAGAVAVLAMVWIGTAAGSLLATIAGLTIGAVLGGAIATIGSDEPAKALLGGPTLLGAVGGAAGLSMYFVGTDTPITGGLAAASVVVGLGIVNFRIEAIGEGAVSRAIAWILRVGFMTAVLTLLVTVIRLDVNQLIATIGAVGPLAPLVSPPDETAAALGFVVLTWLVFAAVWLVVTTLPPAAVVPDSRRPTYRRVRSRLVTIAGVLLGGGGIFLGLVYLVAIETGVAPSAITAIIGAVVESPALRSTLLQGVLVGVSLAGLLLFARSIGVTVMHRQPAWISSAIVIAVGILIGAVAGAGPAIDLIGSAGGIPAAILEPTTKIVGTTAIGMFGGVLGLVAIAAVLAVMPMLSGLGLLPTTTAGPRLVVGGILVAVIIGAIGDVAASALFVATVSAVIAWDVGEYGVGQTADVGLLPARRDGEFVHAGASLLVGIGGLISTLVLYQLVTGIDTSGEGVLVVVVVGTIATVVLAVLLRG